MCAYVPADHAGEDGRRVEEVRFFVDRESWVKPLAERMGERWERRRVRR